MPLYCGEPDIESCEWFYIEPEDFTTLQTKRRKRCCSCNSLININDVTLRFHRFRYPTDWEVNVNMHSEDTEINIADYHMCEGCGDQYFNLSELGFCTGITDNIFDLLEDYKHDYLNSESL